MRGIAHVTSWPVRTSHQYQAAKRACPNSAARRDTAPIDKAEASRVLSQYLTDIVQKGLDNMLDNGGDIAAQVELTNQIVTLIQTS